MMKSEITDLKRTQLEKLAEYRNKLRTDPHLRWLFFEITDICNLNCIHCGSSCTAKGSLLSVDDIVKTLGSIKSDKPMICLTGGEPMLHPDFYKIAETVHHMGYYWGMTTNATLIDEKAAWKLDQAGMSTVSVSIDGMERSHDALRCHKGSWYRALKGVRSLQKMNFHPQVTTVIHQGNIDDIEPLYQMLCEMKITSWRLINVEPIGRACESDGLLLSKEQFSYLISYIREKRYDINCPMEVTYGCSHYLGIENERMVRDHYFMCGAGILTASVRSNGDICACLDVENIPELVQGNIRDNDFMDIWTNKFEAFRYDRTSECEKCRICSERFICGGDSAHTWDHIKNRPLLCYQDF